MSNYYRLEGHNPVPCTNREWSHWFETTPRHVDKTELEGDVRVSTVFLGLDHSFGDGEPLLFETMIFGGPHDGYQERCSTWDQAVEMHRNAVEVAMKLKDWNNED